MANMGDRTMKAYSFKFAGHYPVGACGVVVSTSKASAIKVVNAELERNGFAHINKDELVQIDMTKEEATILLNGDY